VTGDIQRAQLELEFDWSEAAEAPAQVATQFLVQIGMPADGMPDGVHMVVGYANPPVIVGKDEESRQAQADRYNGRLPVTVHGRYFMTRARLEELRATLDEVAKRYDELTQAGGEQ
jgi:hypothetical protein